jgi:CRISPR-associated endonuclease Csn1
VALTATGFSTYHELEKDIKENMKSPYYVRFNKGVGESGNFTIYEVRSYYCIEVYTDTEGSYGVRGIRYVDLYKKKGSLYLKKPLQEGYRHVIYIFQNEYIRAYNPKGKLKNNGFGSYRGVENINQCTGKIRLFSNGGLNGRDTYISFAGLVEKVEMSLLGHIMGTVKCGDQSLFMTERN